MDSRVHPNFHHPEPSPSLVGYISSGSKVSEERGHHPQPVDPGNRICHQDRPWVEAQGIAA